jgi:hypothetical protein
LLLAGISRVAAAIVAVATSRMLLVRVWVLGIVAIVAVFLGGIHAGRCGRCVRLHLLMVGGVLSRRGPLAPRGGLLRGAGAQLGPAVVRRGGV